MILKFKLQDGTWEYIDKVEYPKAGRSGANGEKFVDYVRGGEDFSQDIQNGGYLMSDEGKTVERMA